MAEYDKTDNTVLKCGDEFGENRGLNRAKVVCDEAAGNETEEQANEWYDRAVL